ncbi:MAG: type I-C CRISPR-associated protein Cas8c/Csd1 [Fusicatenibacter sp.]|nr:type I-C CRISPR-associated protein Cas8c/Csd1 [Fusicatenibacter sp.]
MSWANELYQVYENNCDKEDEKIVLLPIYHSTANAQIEVTISEDGMFISAIRLEDKNDSVTIIPVTEDSGSRGSGIAPHPFADKLVYLAGDYRKYTSGKRSDNENYYKAYMEQLELWRDSGFSHPAVNAVWCYLKQGTLMEDLIRSHCLILDEAGEKLKEKEKILGIAQEDAFVRFRIQYADFMAESRTWKDTSLYRSFEKYVEETAEGKQLCYATGKVVPCTYKHPSKIRNARDKAKLISSNDESGFTYRGRFDSKEQALSVSYEFSQKLHNALKWLISKQGVPIGSMVFLAWTSNLQPLPEILGNPEEADNSQEDIWEDDWEKPEGNNEENEKRLISDTMPAYHSRVRKAIWGSGGKEALDFGTDASVKAMILVMDAATTGRLSMNLYEELPISEFYENVEKWRYDTVWIRFDGRQKKKELRSFTLYEIADNAYGTEQGNFIKCKPEMKNDVILRLIPCVVEGKNVPDDIVENLIHKACRPTSYQNRYNWIKVLETACGLIRKKIIEEKEKRKEKEEYEVALDETCRKRDYLYGRLLAIAEMAETSTYEKKEGRITNANRYFEAFSNKPYQTWGVIYNRLNPYLNKMGPGLRRYYENKIGEVMELFDTDEFQDNSKLKPLFLLAYHCQLNQMSGNKNANDPFTEEEK